ncbi:Isochorismatase domain-containing protein 2 [Armadillidium nasatum]|uniref:Isochorismatase domain-containing protein 1 n=1 Tax=Armadillidium nasatum TaxID=96803 RepID=A0A5N5T410_9CRUS|nr:Isochorismatase domain-containing protein 2 [Armadillidium nasatum]
MANITRISKSIGKLSPKTSMLFLCDMQEKFRNNIVHFPEIVSVSNRLLKAYAILESPIVCTEQYSKGLGHTVKELEIEKYGVKALDKTQFSMCLQPINEVLKDKGITSVVLCGIEGHVCVQNTALDLIEQNIDVHVVVDAVSSRSMMDRLYAFDRMKASGAFLTTSESVILGLAGGSHHPKFKELQKIIWESAPVSGLIPKST